MSFNEISPQSDRPAVLRYGFAVLAVGLAVLIRFPLQGLFNSSVPSLFCSPAIVAAGWYGGLGPGLTATGLSSLTAFYFLLPPYRSFAVATFAAAVQIALFVAIGVFISLLNEGLHRARRRAEGAARESRQGELELRRAQSEAIESEERFRITADSAAVMLWRAGPAGGRDWFNKGWLEFTGRPLEAELGAGWSAGIHPDDRDRCLKAYAEAFDARRELSAQSRLRRADGEYRWLLDHGIPRYAAGR